MGSLLSANVTDTFPLSVKLMRHNNYVLSCNSGRKTTTAAIFVQLGIFLCLVKLPSWSKR